MATLCLKKFSFSTVKIKMEVWQVKMKLPDYIY